MTTQTEVIRLSRILEERTTEYEGLIVDAAQAEHAHKLAYAKAVVATEARSVVERESLALLDSSETHSRRLIAVAARDACLEVVRSVRAQLSALQSLLRAEVDLER